ncbi:MAG: ThuA domain-containing protein, partial [Planctomycetota bacterium]
HEVVTRKDPGSLSLAEAQLKEASRGDFDVDATQECAAVSKENLARYDAVAFYTTGELPLAEGQREALLEFVRNGGGFVGIHPATDTFYEWPAYGEMLGGRFDGHPWHGKVSVRVEDPWHPSTLHLAPGFEIEDEIYQFKDWDRAKVRVLLSLEARSVDLGAKGVNRKDRDFALAWCREFGEGRVFYTALGHREEAWRDPRYLRHVVEGIRWAMGRDVDEEGFRPLLGRDRATGWKRSGRGALRVEEGVATADGGPGLSWFAARPFEAFVLRLEFLQEKPGAEFEVVARFPYSGHDPLRAAKGGDSIRVGDTEDPAKWPAPARPPGEWNELEVAFVLAQSIVRLNARTSGWASSREFHQRPFIGGGYFGIEDFPDTGGVRFRNVRLRELPADAVTYDVLFEGDLAGWKMAGPGGFDVAGDALVSRGGMGLLWHERPFRDFLLLLDWKAERREDNSGVFVRFPAPGDDPWVAVNKGYEIQICDTGARKHRTGSIYDFQDSTRLPTAEPGSWNHLEVSARGDRYEVRVNGRRVNRFSGDRSVEGFIGVQNHDEASRVSFRNIRVVGLRPE